MTELQNQLAQVQPQAVELEAAVLGALMLDRTAYDDIGEILSPSSFYKEEYSKIYAAIQDLARNDYPVDLLTVTEELKKRKHLAKVGGPMELVELTNRVASAANIEYHARIIKEKEIKRRIIRTGYKMGQRGHDNATDPFDLLEEAQKDIFGITNDFYNGQIKPLSAHLPELLRNTEAARNREEEILGIPTGFVELDKQLTGLRAPDLITIAARPGMGKTSLVLAIARNAAQLQKKKVGFFSLEMSAGQLITRLISIDAQLPGHILRDPKRMSNDQFRAYCESIERLDPIDLFIDDTPGINIYSLRAKARKIAKREGLDLIVIDYLQLMGGTPGNKNREQEVSQASRGLKELAKELNVPVIALSQLSRSVEIRGGQKRPQLSDLRESGAIEQDSDVVMFIYRPEYYQIKTYDDPETGQEVSTSGIAELIIAKHRHGACDTVVLNFVDQRAEFRDWPKKADLFEDQGKAPF
jgi:replicative DNA helicase